MIYKLSILPDSAKNIFSDEPVYWYPMSIQENTFTSLNITKINIFNELTETWKSDGRIVADIKINKDVTCFFYSGSIGDRKIIPIFGIQPLVIKGKNIYYYFSEKDLVEYYKQIKDMIKNDILSPTWGDSYEKRNLEMEFKKKECDFIEKYSIEELLMQIFFKHLTPKWKPDISKIELEECDFCSPIGLNIILNIIKFLPDDVWENSYDLILFEYMLKEGFLSEWTELSSISDKNDFISKCNMMSKNKINDEISIKNFQKNIITNLINKNTLFQTLYYITRYNKSAETLKMIMDNFFMFYPEKTKTYLKWPYFQPKIIIENFELHFIQIVPNISALNSLIEDIRSIFENVEMKKIRIYHNSEGKKLYRYRIISKVILPKPLDYLKLTKFFEQTIVALKGYIEDNNLSFKKEIWLKRINITIMLHPNFEINVLNAISNNMYNIINSDFDLYDDENQFKIIHGEIICDYSYKYLINLDLNFQKIFVELNESLYRDFKFGFRP